MELSKLRNYTGLFTGYTELRAQTNRSYKIAILNGDIVANEKSSQSGISARVFNHGNWGFASNPQPTDEGIKDVIRQASGNAAFLAAKASAGPEALPVTVADSVNDFTTRKPKRSQQEIIDFLKHIDRYIKEKYPRLMAHTTALNSLDMEKTLITSTGSASFSMTPRSLLALQLTVEKDGQPYEHYEIAGGRGQFEDCFDDIDKIYDTIEQAYQKLIDKSEGVYARAGLVDVIMDADLAGILAHEAIGHTTEADLVDSGSVAGFNLNKPVASELVTLVDYANTFKGQTCPVPVYVDDEGTQATDAVIIENGILKGFMHNKESAKAYGATPTGNARAFEFSDEPLIRMRNTAIVPGSSKLDDMIASIDDGYYLVKSGNGQADLTSEFMFGITVGYEIKDGKLGQAIKDTTISGIAFDVLQSVTMISDEMKWSCAGMCGKKQAIPVGMGGPAIKCKVNIGGK